MHSISTCFEPTPAPKYMGEMRVGEYAELMEEPYVGDVVVRLYGGTVMSLNNPTLTWVGFDYSNGLKVRSLKRGESFTVDISG